MSEKFVYGAYSGDLNLMDWKVQKRFQDESNATEQKVQEITAKYDKRELQAWEFIRELVQVYLDHFERIFDDPDASNLMFGPEISDFNVVYRAQADLLEWSKNKNINEMQSSIDMVKAQSKPRTAQKKPQDYKKKAATKANK